MADEENNEEQGGGKSKGLNKVIIFIAVGVFGFLVIIGGLIVFLLTGNEEMTPTLAEQAIVSQSDSPQEAVDIKINKTYLSVGALYELPLLTLNLIARKGKSYLRAKISLEMDNAALMGELDNKKTVMMDIVISILTSKTVEDLSSIKGKARTKQEIIATLNKSLVDGKIKNLFFTEFIIQ